MTGAKIPPTTVFIGQLPVFQPDTPSEDRDDYRAPPAGDRDPRYGDAGTLGNYSPSLDRYPSPDEVRRFTGFGATAEDLDRGFVEPVIRERAAYDLANYKERWTVPRSPDVDDNPATASEDDRMFRRRHERSRGFLTRPRIPTDR